MENNFKFEDMHACSTSCFHSFKQEYNTLMYDMEHYSKQYEKIIYKLSGDTIKIIGVRSDKDALMMKEEAERKEYELLKNEFDPDPEDNTDEEVVECVEEKKSWFNRWFNK